MPNTNPRSAWTALREGNARFVAGTVRHPSQGIDRRAELVHGQRPTAVLLGCSDSRVAAEIIFDQGLGDMFVIRTAGHVLDSAVLGSLEFAVDVLGVPLIVVLGHDSCGAVAATLNALDGGEVPRNFMRTLVEHVTPSILKARRRGYRKVDEFEAYHVLETAELIMDRSRSVRNLVDEGKCAIVGVTYALDRGQISVQGAFGLDDDVLYGPDRSLPTGVAHASRPPTAAGNCWPAGSSDGAESADPGDSSDFGAYS